eukprot:scaffold32261_cov61-Phaeocystis_antarctica.AAC.6
MIDAPSCPACSLARRRPPPPAAQPRPAPRSAAGRCELVAPGHLRLPAGRAAAQARAPAPRRLPGLVRRAPQQRGWRHTWA